jgi:single-strand DNA-binding protein
MVSKTILLGRCGKDPEIRNLNSGDKVANFSLATSKSWKNKSGVKEEKTSWHQIVVFGKLAEIVEKYVTKGTQLYLEGELSYEDYEKDGIKRQSTKIIVNQLTMLGGGDKAEKPESKPQQQEKNTDMGPEDDMLPF